MSLKAKLISSISMFVLVLALLVVSVFALRQESFSLGGTISFEAKNVYAEITGTISGQENGPASLPKLEFSNNKTPDTSGWAKGALVFDPNVSPIQIKIEINVKNLSKERALYVKVEDLIGAVANLTKSVTVGEENKEGTYVKVLPLGILTYTISLSPTDEGESVTGEYNYLITLIDESETQDIEIQAKPNMETLGSVSGGGAFDLGDTVELTATTESGSTFLAWATSLKPNEMEIVSTSETYSFELTMDSPRTYYALFNSTETEQTGGGLKYTIYEDAKLAEITGRDSSFQGGDFTIPSVVPSGENSYKVYSIGPSAFSYCSSLTSITIPEGVTSIGQYAFSGCSSLTSVSLPSTLTSIDNSTFSSCRSLTSITIPEGVTSIGTGAFSYCSSLTSITIPEGVTSIGSSAFRNCNGLTSISLPNTLTSIGSQAFDLCGGLEAFYGTGNTYFTIDDNRALIVDGGETLLAYAVANTKTAYSIPNGVTSIGDYAFYKCSSLTSITIPEGVSSIGSYAFNYCSSLTSITILEGVTSIGTGAFSNCSSLTSITLPSTLTSIGNSAFNYCSGLTEITIPERVTSIGSGTFQNCSSLVSVKIPEGVTSIGGSAFRDCSSLEAFHGTGNSYFTINDNRALIVDGGKTLLAYAAANPATSYSIPEGVTSIGSYAFNGCSSLTSITNLEGVTSIGSSAFSDCSNLTSIIIPEGVTSIGSGTFQNCSSLVSIKIPEGVTSIGNSAFSGCSNLTEITIPEDVTSIGSSAFDSCSSLTEITINGNISILGLIAFQSCTNLTKLTLGAGVTSIPSNLFIDSNLLKLTEIIVEEGSSLTAALPGYGTWVKDEGSEDVPNFSGAGTYTRTDVQ